MQPDITYYERTLGRSSPLASIGLLGWLGTNSGLTGGLGIVCAMLLIAFSGTPIMPIPSDYAPLVIALSVALAVLHWTLAIGLWQQRHKVALLWSLAIVLLIGGIAASILSVVFVALGSKTSFVVPPAVCAATQLLLGVIFWSIYIAYGKSDRP